MITQEKQLLRHRALESLRALGSADRVAMSLAIGHHLTTVAGPVFGYVPLRLEPDWLSAWNGGEVALPRVSRETLAFHRVTWRTPLALTEGPFGAREPVADEATRIAAAHARTVLVPGLVFDRSGRRLGRGGGFYDRFLADPTLTARRVGVCFGCQLVEAVPVEAHDQLVDAILTENGWIETRSNERGRD